MKCYVCGNKLVKAINYIPFKVSHRTIAIIKDLPVMECPNCKEYLIEDSVMERVESILNGIDDETELEIVNFNTQKDTAVNTIQE